MKHIIYKDFAFVYDAIMSDYYTSMWWRNFERLRKKAGLKYKTVADVGCGTGLMAQKFVKQGKKVFLVDQSAEMLEVAQRRCPTQPVFQQNMMRFDCSCLVDLVVSVHGTIHYLKNKKELKQFFSQVYKQLKPGGAFCFDQFTEKHLKTYFGGGKEVFEGEDYVSIWHHRWQEKQRQSEIIIDTFLKQGQGWQRSQSEMHRQKAFLWKDLQQILGQIGFEKIVSCQLPDGKQMTVGDEKRMILAFKG